ncbi:cell division protein SepF [Adlercreutzia sp. ZJ242]|uniref:cell division protein SepF n=1 Tax=Adlercreutzia sp. ZJ242 TaxID=2709409 RepID=UPI0013ED9FF3|nr:cell division protein SepF [Adlercreutzia sp. ZJ242]
MDLQDGKRMLGDLKSKLGFGSKGQDAAYDDGYDDYDDYDDGYDDYADNYGDGYDDYAPASSSYDRYAPVTTRSVGSGRQTGSGSSMPRLVSIDDVRASTQVPGSLNRDPLPPRHVTTPTTNAFGRTMVDSSLPPQMTPEGTAAVSAAASRRRSEGLDSLFTPTTEEAAAAPASGRAGAHAAAASAHGAHASAAGSASSSSSAGSAGAYDPYDSYTGSSTGSYTGRRTLTVIAPASYGEVERVAKSLKAGDVVVLALGEAPDALAKRVLDFSFGVASALEASVECVADKVFVVARGSGLSEVERMNLRNQGVL